MRGSERECRLFTKKKYLFSIYEWHAAEVVKHQVGTRLSFAKRLTISVGCLSYYIDITSPKGLGRSEPSLQCAGLQAKVLI